ncbi:bifunctional hydroxy-methylpyrimidine kinase and hydroxy-phosphomethylpyrimidine kinase [Bradyrhizobium vignae]|uniref:hydroxymethylpyrimidine kinase n=2 Tax=Bradyrhizobium vignae TaxID=1549949 RepID=A0A2U3PYK8_9BRAD|nr:bifunctional hydroxy-methylpyrimidine kinase and hydroxy-phosphomethylpyrimidine kinase [Bradyrhizobium vignae]
MIAGSWPRLARLIRALRDGFANRQRLLLFHGRARRGHGGVLKQMYPAMTTPVALTIAGSDSSGGAGIQADLKTFAALGVYGASVITALTAQNTRGVTGIHAVPAEFVTAQMDAVFSDLEVGAVKIGMVAQAASIDAIAAALSRWAFRHVVLDPVMVATSGDRLLASEAVDALRTKLIPLATVITPNLPEAAALLDEPMAASEAEIESQGRRLLSLGCRAVLVKGGHGEGAESIDYLVGADTTIALAAPRLPTKNTHGTGCSLSSAIAAGLAKGEGLENAVRNAKAWISAAIGAADRFSVGHGHAPIHHFHKFY